MANTLFNIATPHRNDTTRTQDRSDMGVSFGDVDSFVEPAPKDRKRAPLVARSDNIRKAAEFTPLLRTATKKNRMMSFETPSNQTTNSIAENSGLTPVNWQKDQLPLLKTQGSLAGSNHASPAQSEMLGDAAGIREQEKAMDKMKKENWELKLKVFLMEKQMHQSAPEHVQQALKENIEYKVQVTSLSKDIAKYKKALADTERKVASLGDQVSASMSQVECQLDHGMSEEERAKLKAMEQERDTLLNEREDAEMKIRELEAEIDKLDADHATIEDLQKEIEDLNHKLGIAQGSKQEAEKLLEQNEELQEEIENLREEIDSVKSKHDDLLSQTRSADNDDVVELLREQLEEKADTIKDLTHRLRLSETESGALQARLDNLQIQLQKLEERNDNLEADLEALQAEYDTMGTEKDQLELKCANNEMTLNTIKAERTSLEKTIHLKSQEITRLKEDLNERYEDIEEFRGAADDRSREFRMLEEKLERQNESVMMNNNATLNRLEDELSEAKMSSREAEREIRQLKSTIDQLQDELNSACKLLP